MRRLPIAVLVLALAACSDAADRGTARVAEVVDGDTIVLADGRRVRLVQIDAPEPAEDECYGPDATAELRALLPEGTPVLLETDPRLDDTDRFGRELRYVFRDETNVNLELVRRGAASAYFFRREEGRYADDLLAAARRAELEGLGLWGACPSARLDPFRGVDSGRA